MKRYFHVVSIFCAMQKGTIRLCYRKIIDVASANPWDKLVFEDTYTEFRMQVQFYNSEKKYALFSELLYNVPGADKLHFLVSAALIPYLKQLNGKVPDILNNPGKTFLPFNKYRFEIIESHVTDRSKHRVAVNFYSDGLTWHDTIGNQLLVSIPGQTEAGETLTELVSLQPFLSIYSLKE